jgi:signal transduction histidine kinase
VSVAYKAVERQADATIPNLPLVTADMPISAAQLKVALGVILLILVIELCSIPFAHLPVARINAFLPALQTAMCVLHLITAVLLFSQYSVRPQYPMLAVASAYVFGGLFAFEQTLAFPGAYSKDGLIGDGLNTAAMMFLLWHTTFPLGLIVYGLTKETADRSGDYPRSPHVVIAAVIAFDVAAIAGSTWLAVVASPYLPPLHMIFTRTTPALHAIAGYLWLLNSATLVLLLVRRRTILDLWLIITLFAWWPLFLAPICTTVVPFSIGWYVARCLAVIASSGLLVVLLTEMTMIYARLANSIYLLRRERAQRLVSVEAATAAMAHEIRQPLTGISSQAAAGLNWLRRKPANVEKALGCLTSIVEASHHAEEIIGSIRELFKKAPFKRTMVQLNEVCHGVMRLVEHDLIANGISVTVECAQDLPRVRADFIQLQQVMLNLVRNAIEAMSQRPSGKRYLRVRSGFDGKSTVSVYILDSGPGVPVQDRERIFNPFYTTKPSGTGLGLAVCRTIIEEHEGTLRLAKTGPQGSIFEIALPFRVTVSSVERSLQPAVNSTSLQEKAV